MLEGDNLLPFHLHFNLPYYYVYEPTGKICTVLFGVTTVC